MGGFKKFLMRGNVVDLAVAVVIGAAFTAVVTAFVKGMINPVVGAFGTKNLDGYTTCIKGPCGIDAKGQATGVQLLWGSVLGAALTFLITAAVVYFLLVLPLNHMMEKRKRALGHAGEKELSDTELLVEIRDLLAARLNPEAEANQPNHGATGSGSSHSDL
ncbi:large conductance mechanosensitive channel protein MscL [Embleya sp. NBC_00888]|uniref:large conductance mechanosensitive channel protein MscL n=1 Tax=Embleya sp. NBC_00888 TaxID=2975960 RepID=UPI003867A08D|nr:large conductance mechanosensitive channel protein MscL [Embleya sp. NBC_00888]